MATQYQNLSDYNPDLMPDKDIVAEQQYGIVVAEWNPAITTALLEGAYKVLVENGVRKSNINVVHVPGTFELTFGAKQMMEDYINTANNVNVHRYAAIIVLGCVIQGDTPHFNYVCQSVTQGVTNLNSRPDACPVIFGVLTTNTLQQAKDRSGGIHGNKGDEAAITALKMANIVW